MTKLFFFPPDQLVENFIYISILHVLYKMQMEYIFI